MGKTKSHTNAKRPTADLPRERSLVVAAATAHGSNNLIVGSSEEELVMKPGKVPIPKDHVLYVPSRDMDAQLTAQFNQWKEMVGSAHARLYNFLGQVYEWAPLVKEQEGTESEIIALIKERHDYDVPEAERSGEQLLLLLIVGVGPRANSNRHNWLKALRAAEDNDTPRDRTPCAAWLSEAGGVISAGKKCKQQGSPQPRATEAFDAPLYLSSIAPDGPRLAITLPKEEMVGDLSEGLHVLVVNVSRKGKARTLEVLEDVQDPSAVEALALRHRSQTERLDRLLWALNRYALKHAERWDKKMTEADLKGFVKAANTLVSDPQLRAKFFDADVDVPRLPEDVSAKYRLPVVDFDLNVHDPARFIRGAKPGTLLPYKPDPRARKKMSTREFYKSETPVYINKHVKKQIDVQAERRFWEEQLDREAEEELRKSRQAEREAGQLEDV